MREETGSPSRAGLGNLDLTNSDLRGANLVRADLRGAHLQIAHLELAKLAGAVLAGANLAEANLILADAAGSCVERFAASASRRKAAPGGRVAGRVHAALAVALGRALTLARGLADRRFDQRSPPPTPWFQIWARSAPLRPVLLCCRANPVLAGSRQNRHNERRNGSNRRVWQ
jgi:hypothetical protein